MSYNIGKTVETQEIGGDCGCKKRCFEVIGKQQRERIFSEFCQYTKCIFHGRLKIGPVKRRYTKKKENSRRNNTV